MMSPIGLTTVNILNINTEKMETERFKPTHPSVHARFVLFGTPNSPRNDANNGPSTRRHLVHQRTTGIALLKNMASYSVELIQIKVIFSLRVPDTNLYRLACIPHRAAFRLLVVCRPFDNLPAAILARLLRVKCH